jgi:type I restriction enzyme S subunit
MTEINNINTAKLSLLQLTKLAKQKVLAELLNNDEWKTVRLWDVCDVTSSKRIYQSEYVNNGVSFYRTKEIVELNKKEIISTTLFISQERYDEIKNQFGVPQENDILISAVGTIGISWIVDNRNFYFKDGNLLWLRDIKANAKFVKFFLDNIFGQNSFDHGGAYNALTIEKLKQFEILLPPLAVQQQTVSQIETLFAEVDRIEQSRNRMLQNAKLAKQKVLAELLNNDEWKSVKLGEVCDVKMGQSPDGQSVSNDNLGIEFHQGKICFTDKYLRKSDVYTSQPTKIAEANSLLLCVRAPVGVVNITERKICIGRGLCAINPKKDVDFKFVYYWLQTKEQYFNEKATGTTFKAISGDIIKNAEIPLPSLAVQQQTVAKIESIFAEIERIERVIKN